MTFKTEEIAEVYAEEQALKENGPEPPDDDAAPSLLEILYIGGTPAKNGKNAFVPEGFNVTGGIRKKKIPNWVLGEQFYWTVFGVDAMKRARIAYLFWRVGLTVPQIQNMTHWKGNYIRNVISKLRQKGARRKSFGKAL
jgi:hypothetical protein